MLLQIIFLIGSLMPAVLIATGEKCFCGFPECRKSWDILNEKLPPAEKRIVSGVQSNGLDWPWNVALKTRDGEHVCGGTLINSLFVVTAAYCVYQEEAASFYVSLGDFERLVADTCQRDIDIKEISIHPSFDPPTYQNDIAVIRLAEEVSFDKCHIRPICLPRGEEFFDEKSLSGVVAGWGLKRGGGLRSGPIPRKELVTAFRMLPPSSCANWVGPFYDRNTMICAVNYETQVCNGDGGAGLVTVTRHVPYPFEPNPCPECPVYTLAGVTSWAIKSCDVKIPSGYARLTASTVSWIMDVSKDGYFCPEI